MLNGLYCMHACRPTAVKQLANFSARLAGMAGGQGCWARLPGKAAWQGCRAMLPGKAAGQGWQARLPGKGYRARLPGKSILPYCKSEPVRTCLDSSARQFWLTCSDLSGQQRAQGCRACACKTAGKARARLPGNSAQG
jgi:hypothetical protein